MRFSFLDDDSRLSRRDFLRVAGTSAGALAAGSVTFATACDSDGPTSPVRPSPGRSLLRIAPTSSPAGLSLTAHPAVVDVGGSRTSPALAYNGLLPGPTIRARTGDTARILLQNSLAEETTVHWHGVRVPSLADGLPQQTVLPGASYTYEFPIAQRAGTSWYHPHPHHRTAKQVYQGLAGLFLVEDDEERALGLPSGPYEIALVLQDKRLNASGELAFDRTDVDMHEGFLGSVPFGNGVREPWLEVETTLYRFRVVNASNARIFRLGLSSGERLTIIGNDGGLLEVPAHVADLLLSPGERVDLLIDFSGLRRGDRVMLQSLEFSGRSGEGSWGGSPPSQGEPLDLLQLVVGRTVSIPAGVPPALSHIPTLSRAEAQVERSFSFSSGASGHRINGLLYEMDRVDFRVPFNQVELWSFRNDSGLPHPVHVHGASFQVQARYGGRGAVFPWEQGWKDTVLLLPGERVEVLIRFDAYRGLYLMHCHNLEHEDMGMMLNFEVY